MLVLIPQGFCTQPVPLDGHFFFPLNARRVLAVNKNCHRTIFSRRLGAWVAVAETVGSQGKCPRANSRGAMAGVAGVLLLAAALAGVPGAVLAQMVNINVPGSLTAATGGTTPADGAIWNLNSDGIYHSGNSIQFPTGPAGLTINGNGRTLTLNNSAVSPPTVVDGRFTSNSASRVTVNLSDITITGANSQSLVGGAFEAGSTGGLTINTSGTVRFTDNLRNYLGGAITVANGGLSLATTGGDIYLTGNTARTGGALYVNGGLTLGNAEGIVSITGNTTSTSHGGAIYSHGGVTTITGRAIELSNNHQTAVQDANGVNTAADGGAINADNSVIINGELTMNNNSVASPRSNGHGLGGGIFAGNGNVAIVPNVIVHGSVSADGNVASTFGGAIYTERGNVFLAVAPGEGSVSLTNNRAEGGNGGAIVSGTIAIGNADGTVAITGNSAKGGAASSGGALDGKEVTIAGREVAIDDNEAVLMGGAIHSSGGVTITGRTISLSNNETTGGAATFSGGVGGGAIYAIQAVQINGALTMNGNHAAFGTISDGGAIHVETGGVHLDGGISAGGNTASRHGGAIFAAAGAVDLSTTTGDVVLTNNTAAGNGGAVDAASAAAATIGNVTIGNADGAVTITDNRATGSASSNGGAIYAGGTATLTNATVSGNSADQLGGAIYALGGVALNATGGDVTFSGNRQNTATTARANAIYFGAAGTAAFNAAAGNTIAFYDPIANNGTQVVTVNVTGGGTVLFDGANYTNAADRTSSIRADTTVYGAGTTFRVDNGAVYGATNSTMNVQAGAVLAGNGTVTGGTTLADGAILNPGGASAVGTLTINGNLALGGDTTTLNYRFGEANVVGGPFNDLTQVNGNLTLNGTLNVSTTPGGSFDPGVYRVINYTGTLTNNTLDLGTMPSPGFSVQTSVDKQVNLVNASGTLLDFWDGTAGPKDNSVVDGGDGTWHNGGRDNNWTTAHGTVNAPWAPAAFAVFQGSPGTVTVDNSQGQVTASGMQFAVDGYRVTGEPISLVETEAGAGRTIVRVGDGAESGAAYAATIGAVLQGDTQLAKHDLGTLVLEGANTYTGGTAIEAGTLQVGQDANLGAAGTALSIDSGTLATTASFATGRDTTLGALGGTFDVANGTTLGMSGEISGTGALTKANTGTLQLSGASNSYSGATNVNAGTLKAGAAGTFSPGSAVNVAAAGTLDLNGFSQTAAGLTNAGMVNMGTGTAPGTVLTVAGDYVGNGGTVAFNTLLAADDSATDKLVVDGAISGQSKIAVTNAGGVGALTTGNGIQLVQANGGSTADAFALGSRVAGGAYEYRLYQGGLGADAGNPNWYLRSTLDCGVDPSAVECDAGGGNGGGNGGGGNGGDGGNGGGGIPIYRPEVVVDTAIAALASRVELGMLGTWHERTSGRYTAHELDASGQPMAGWARMFGQTGSVGQGFSGRVAERNAAFENHGSSYDFSYGGFQAGMDLWRSEGGDGSRDLAGFYVGSAQASGDVGAVMDLGYGRRAGSLSMDSYTLGGYYTHIAPSGWYVDTVLQGTRYSDVKATSSAVQSQTLETSGRGIMASVEGGYPIALGDDWAIEPQAQLVYQGLNFKDGADAFGGVAFQNSNAVYGRVAGRLQKELTNADGTRTALWARASLWSDFGSEAKTTFTNLAGANPATLKTDLGGNWAQIDVGVSGQVSRNVSAFATANYGQSLGGGKGHGWGARAGIKVAW